MFGKETLIQKHCTRLRTSASLPVINHAPVISYCTRNDVSPYKQLGAHWAAGGSILGKDFLLAILPEQS